jgi:CRISPR/Cas system-associated exonuclease Cas4 (RecB family)
MKKIFVSATGITDFLSCPYKFKLRQMWRVKESKDNLGLIVHRALQEDKEPQEAQAKAFYKQLKELMHVNQIRIKYKERKERFEIIPGVIFTRVMDVIGTEKGEPVIVDYKTADWPWEEVWGHSPQTRGIQAAAYLYPGCNKSWPNKITFLVVNKRSRSQIFSYRCTTSDFVNLISAIKLITLAFKNNTLPYNRGKTCRYCDWSAACFKACGWRRLYEPYDREENE